MRGKHARKSKMRKYAPSVAAVGGALAVSASFPVPAGASASSVPSGGPGAPEHAQLAARDYRPVVRAPRTQPGRYTIRSGDTLSDIAGQFCGSAAKYPVLAANNRIADPDVIYPGRQLSVACRLLHAVTSTWKQARHADSRGRIWGVTYGYPNFCGDGDGDGFDIPCWKLHRGSAQPVSSGRHTRRVYASSRSYGGTLSYGQIEDLWVRAGGPSWARSAAARVANCESGGRANAYNPSGATGVFQILGSVVGGDLRDPMVNARNAVAKFNASGQTWAQWTCKP